MKDGYPGHGKDSWILFSLNTVPCRLTRDYTSLLSSRIIEGRAFSLFQISGVNHSVITDGGGDA